jgi:hypothetical protein
MELKDFNMNGAELETVTKNLMKAVLRNLDWQKVQETFFNLSGELTEEQREACLRMFTETQEQYQDFDEDLDNVVKELNLSSVFDSALNANMTDEHLKPQPVC